VKTLSSGESERVRYEKKGNRLEIDEGEFRLKVILTKKKTTATMQDESFVDENNNSWTRMKRRESDQQDHRLLSH